MIGLAFLSFTVQNSYYGQEGYKMPAVRKVNATEMKQRLGQYLDYAMAGPVMVEKSGRSVVVLLSVEEYERLCAYEDAYWGQKALEAEKSGWASEEDVSALVERFNREEAGTK
jgi:prevent-host-death family protein